MALLLLFVVVPVVVVVLLLLNYLIAPSSSDAEKDSVYECGFTGQLGQTRQAFPIAYYLVAVLFSVLDVELLLWTPIVVSLYAVGTYGFIVAALFFIVLTLGFVYELGQGVLHFTDQRSAVVTPKKLD